MDILSRVARAYLSRTGNLRVRAPSKDGFSLFKFDRSDGEFDYERYRSIQNEGNRRKIENVFADQDTINFIADYLVRSSERLERGICHGTRRGMEQRWFQERLKIEVIGTDIADSASEFPNTVQWDFHNENPEWLGKFDFVYSNSHDHAYDPEKAFSSWINQLKPNGRVILEHTTLHTEAHSSELDPFGIHPLMLPFFVAKWGDGRFYVTNILEPPFTKPGGAQIWIFIIRKSDK